MELSLMLIGRLLLAAVFVTAGAAKLRDLPGSRRAVAEFGVPRRLATVLGTMLPAAELAVAGSLIADPTAAWGALAALALLLAFALAIVWNLGRGRAPDCHCFGQLHSSPASWRTAARNLGLAAVAGFVGVGLAEPALTAAIAAAGVVALLPALPSAWKRAAAAGARPGASGAAEREGLPVGTPAPGFRLPALRGLSVTLDSLRAAGRPVLLVFTDPGCGPCIELAPKVARWQRDHAGELTIAVIERRRDGSAQTGSDEHGRRNVLFQRDGEVSETYGAHGTPTAVLVGADGAIASPVAHAAHEIEALVARNVNGFPAGLGLLEQEGNGHVPSARRRGTIPRPLIRRELLVRGAGAWAATSALLAWPTRAVARVVNCGDERCGNGARCRKNRQGRKRCVCVSSWDTRCEIGGVVQCHDLESGVRHCGGCNKPPCEGDEVCAGGECVTGDYECEASPGVPCSEEVGICCGEEGCVDPNYDENNCGGCEQRCTNRDSTTGAVVKRPECCFGHCVDTHGDPRNCGGCEGDRLPNGELRKPCKQDELCYRGECIEKCPEGLRKCGRTCGQPGTETCCGGKLYAKEDLGPEDKCCDRRIADTQSDNCNCGKCGTACAENMECRNGSCECPPGVQACFPLPDVHPECR